MLSLLAVEIDIETAGDWRELVGDERLAVWAVIEIGFFNCHFRASPATKVYLPGVGISVASILHIMLYFQGHGLYMMVSLTLILRYLVVKYHHLYHITIVIAASQLQYLFIRWSTLERREQGSAFFSCGFEVLVSVRITSK